MRSNLTVVLILLITLCPWLLLSKTLRNTGRTMAPVPVPLIMIFGAVVYPVPGSVIMTLAIPPLSLSIEYAVAPTPASPVIITCGGVIYPVPGFSTVASTTRYL